MYLRNHLPKPLKGLKATPIALAVLACLGSPARSEDIPVEKAASELETIVITGVRSSNAKSIATKKEATTTVDTIAADEIGKLPDFNVGDALKRVTGVNTLSYQGEPRFVIVRGLNANYNVTRIDGFAFATADIGSRQVLMEMLPSNFAQRIDVTKSFLPESDGGAIGGDVNIVTGSAFQLPDGTFTLSAKLAQNQIASEDGGSRPGGEASAKWAKRFGERNEFGLLTTASYWNRQIFVPQVEAGGTLNWYTEAGARSNDPYSGTGYAVPAERRWYNYDNKRTRLGLTSRLDWMPDASWSGHASAFALQQQELSNRTTLIGAVNKNATLANQTANSGTLSSVNQTDQLGRFTFDRALYGVNGELIYEIEPGWNTAIRASVTRSTVSNPQNWDQFLQKNIPFQYTYAPGITPVFTGVNPTNVANTSLYLNEYHREESTAFAENVTDIQADTHKNTDSTSTGFGWALGLRLVSTTGDTSLSRTTWSGLPYNLSNVNAGGGICGFNCNTQIPTIDPALADAAFAANSSKVKGVIDNAGQYAGTYGFREDIYAAYAQGQYRWDKLMIAGGLRLEHTAFNTNGWKSTLGTYGEVQANNSYDNVLPSALMVYDTSSSSKLRASVSQTIGRPRYDQMSTRGGSLTVTGNTGTLTQGNAALKPRRSNNFDVGHDWFLDNGSGILSVAAFYKEISDEIFTFGQPEQMTVDGNNISVLVTQARNASDKVRLSGLEFGLTKDFNFLPAPFNSLGIGANATFTDANYPLTLSDGSTKSLSVMPQQPSQVWNIALYYERANVHAKLAWNHLGSLWDDRYPNFTPSGFYANRYQQATNNLDFQASYDVSKQLTISFDAMNLTSQGMQYNFGKDQEYVQSAWKLPTTFLVGLNYKF